MSWTVFATMMFISSDLICTIKNERLGSIATVLLFAFVPTNAEDQTLERGPLNLGTVATIPWIWTPLSRPIKIRWLRSSVCYSTVHLFQYFASVLWTVFAIVLCILADLRLTMKNERLESIATVILSTFALTNAEDLDTNLKGSIMTH
jgi:hypothetical protein